MVCDHHCVPSQIVGRARSLAVLNAARSPTCNERVVLVSGPAGIGKTTVLKTFCALAAQAGDVIGWGVAGEWQGSSALWPWTEALTALDPLQTVVPSDVADTAQSVEMAELFRNVANWLTAWGTRHSTVLVIEDLHTAHPTAVALFSYLARRPPIPGITVVASTRPRHEPIDEIRCTRVELSGFTPDEIRRFAESVGYDIGESTARDLAHRTNGNPLFVQRLLADAAGHVVATVPPDVAALLRAEIAAFPQETQQIFHALAVLGSAPIEVVSRLVDDVSSFESELASASSVVDVNEGLVMFRHGLFREIMYEDLRPQRRFDLHARAAEILRSSGANTVVLSHHLSRAASSHRSPEAATAARQAARMERAVGAIREAIHNFGLAVAILRELDRPDDLGAALIEEAEALAGAGRGAEAEERLIEAAGLVDGENRERCRLLVRSYCRLRWLEEPNPSAIQAEQLVALATRLLRPEHDHADEAVFHTAMATAGDIQGTLLTDVESADQAVVAAERAADPLLIGEARLARRRALSVHPHRFRERRVDAERALALAAQLGDHEFFVRAQRMALTDALAAADRERALALLASEPVSVAGKTQQALAQATFNAMAGRYEDADEVLDDALKELSYLDLAAPALEFVRIAYSWDVGSLPESLELYEPLLPHIADPALRSAVAISKAMSGDVAVAATLLEETLELVDSGEPSVLWAVSMALAAETAAAIDHTMVPKLYEMLLPFAGECAVASTSAAAWVGAFDRVLGLLSIRMGDAETAIDHLTASLTIHDRMGAKPWSARSHQALALACDLVGDQAASIKHRETAAAIVAQIKMSPEVLVIGDFETDTDRSVAMAAETRQRRAVLRRDGDLWHVGVGNRVDAVVHSKGLAYLAALIASPHKDWHALDLYATVAGTPVVLEGSTGAVLDDRARQAYQERYDELHHTLAAAQTNADVAATEAAQYEIDMLESELLSAFGLGGRSRTTGDPTEKARVNVRRSISRSIARIDAVSPTLAHHLDRSILTGRFCRYEPGPDSPITWV